MKSSSEMAVEAMCEIRSKINKVKDSFDCDNSRSETAFEGKSANVDKVNGLFEVLLEINGKKQLDEKGQLFKIKLKDLKVTKDFEVANWSINENCEIAIRYKLINKGVEEKPEALAKKASDTKLKPHVMSSMIQMDGISSFNFRDRLNIFDKSKKKEELPVLKKCPTQILNENANDSFSTVSTTISSNGEQFLGCKLLPDIINTKNIDEKALKEFHDVFGDGFCEGFFIASFPEKGGQVIEKSQGYPSVCGHKQCSVLPAMQPEIIARYPLKDTKTLELNNLAATICFPAGIKVCYEESPPRTVTNYSTPITNQQGDRYYMMTYHFYFKMLNDAFGKIYEMHPLKHHLMKFADGYIGKDDEIKKEMKKIEENLELCQEFGFREIIYVPYCVCLISKFPYIRQMEKCLQSLFRILSDFQASSSHDINNIIMFLVHSIPIPPNGTKIKFFLPFSINAIEITCPKFKDVNIINYNLCDLLSLFSINEIVTIFRLMLFEKKILFVGKEYNVLSEVTDSFISLLYPFQWVHTYIPIMSDQMIKYLQTFLPFINGIHSSIMPFVTETLVENEDEVYIIYLDKEEEKKSKSKGKVDINFNLEVPDRKRIDVEKKINETTPALPQKIVKKLVDELTSIKGKIKDSPPPKKGTVQSPNSSMENPRANLDMSIRDLFIECFAEMFHDYNKFLCVVDDYVVFNSNPFVESRDPKEANFYKEFTESQLFEQFTQNVLKEDSFNYFNMMIESREKGNKEHNQKMVESNLKSEHVYLIKPDFLHIKAQDSAQIEKELAEKYVMPKVNEFGIFSEDVRIIGRLNPINPAHFDLNKCKCFLLPDFQTKAKAEAGPGKKQKATQITSKVELFESRERKNKEMKSKKPLLKKGENELTEKEREEIKDKIKDIIIRIFKSEDISDVKENKKQIVQLISHPFGREFFIKLLSQNNTNVKILQEEQYKLLLDLVFNTLLSFLSENESEKNLNGAISIFKLANFYGTENKKILWKDLHPKLYNYSPILKQIFWAKWLESEMKEKSTKITELLDAICMKMLELKIEKDFIKKTVEGFAAKYITNEKDLENFKKTSLQKITKFKYA